MSTTPEVLQRSRPSASGEVVTAPAMLLERLHGALTSLTAVVDRLVATMEREEKRKAARALADAEREGSGLPSFR